MSWLVWSTNLSRPISHFQQYVDGRHPHQGVRTEDEGGCVLPVSRVQPSRAGGDSCCSGLSWSPPSVSLPAVLERGDSGTSHTVSSSTLTVSQFPIVSPSTVQILGFLLGGKEKLKIPASRCVVEGRMGTPKKTKKKPTKNKVDQWWACTCSPVAQLLRRVTDCKLLWNHTS